MPEKDPIELTRDQLHEEVWTDPILPVARGARRLPASVGVRWSGVRRPSNQTGLVP